MGEVLALDGPGGAGKTTVSRLTAERLGMARLDTGALYRAVTLAVLRRRVDSGDGSACAAVAADAVVRLTPEGHILLDGEDVTAAIRTGAVTAAVSAVSAHPGVRRHLVDLQRRLAGDGAWVVEGRDIGTVVFPDARLKVFLTASLEARAERRAAELGDGDVGRITGEIAERDRLDSSRADSPLRAAADAVMVDTTGLGAEAVVERIVELWREARGA